MIGLHKYRRKKSITWTVRWRAYPGLHLRFCVLYLHSSTFRSIVRLSIRNRRFINKRVLALGTKWYLLATNSRITIAGFGSFVLPHNKPGYTAAFGGWTRRQAVRLCRQR